MRQNKKIWCEKESGFTLYSSEELNVTDLGHTSITVSNSMEGELDLIGPDGLVHGEDVMGVSLWDWSVLSIMVLLVMVMVVKSIDEGVAVLHVNLPDHWVSALLVVSNSESVASDVKRSIELELKVSLSSMEVDAPLLAIVIGEKAHWALIVTMVTGFNVAVVTVEHIWDHLLSELMVVSFNVIVVVSVHSVKLIYKQQSNFSFYIHEL